MPRAEFSTKTKREALARSGGMRSKGKGIRWLEATVLTTSDACIEWPYGVRDNGYGTMVWRYRRTTAHRVACELAHGAPATREMHAAHSCGNRICCNPRHLRWATVRENHADKKLHGTQLAGDTCPVSKLSSGEVRQIRRELAKNTKNLSEIASEFGVSRSNIWCIKHGYTWRQPNAS